MASILIVEDEVFVREFARVVVEDAGHFVSLAGDLEHARFAAFASAYRRALYGHSPKDSEAGWL